MFLIDINDCETEPCVNGDCTDGDNEYTCNCVDGYEGANCDTSK